MLVPFLIMLREGVEAALIVGIIASYLKQTARGEWMPFIWIGVMLAAALSLFVGAALELLSAEFPQRQQEAFEAIVGLVAVGVLTSMVFWMRKVAGSLRREVANSIESALRTPRGAAIALLGMVFFAVAREGLETVFFLLAVFQQSSSALAPLGALLGLLAAVAIGYGIYSGGMRLNLGRFFRWTGVFILLVAAGVLANAVQALHEAGVWNHLQQVLFDLAPELSLDSPLGAMLNGMFGYQEAPTLSVAVAYLGYLLAVLFFFFRPHPGSTALPAVSQANG